MSYASPRRRPAKPDPYTVVERSRSEARCRWDACNRLGSVRVGVVHYCRQHAQMRGYAGKR